MSQLHISDAVHWYVNELTSRVVAKSGIPEDRFHIGKIMLQSYRDDLDFICQIDGGTGDIETNGSILKRSVQCAISFKKMGLKYGDVMILIAPNHLDLAVPLNAALYLGIMIAPVDRTSTVYELEHTFSTYKPSIIFCQNDKLSVVEAALKTVSSNAQVFTFDGEGRRPNLADLMKADDDAVDSFEAEDFNAEDSIALILPTSGSTGLPKGASITHKACVITGPHTWLKFTQFPLPPTKWLVLSPVQWVTGTVHFFTSPYLKYTRLQTSKTMTVEHARYLIEHYRPKYSAMSTAMMTQLLKPGEEGPCDLTCFDMILIGGSAVPNETVQEIKKASPGTSVVNAYGMTELAALAFQGYSVIGSPGKPSPIYQYRLIDIDTQKDVTEPNVTGELWMKGPGMFKEYYNNPSATKATLTDDRWFKTGDIFYRDEHWNYFFIERIKFMLKYKNFQISPGEIESVIRAHPAVLDVAVTSVPDEECGDLPVAFVIPNLQHNITAQEIKDLVKVKLSDAKQLRGGVIFLNTFPITGSTKIDRGKLKVMAREMKRE